MLTFYTRLISMSEIIYYTSYIKANTCAFALKNNYEIKGRIRFDKSRMYLLSHNDIHTIYPYEATLRFRNLKHAYIIKAYYND
jgi:hypothetical protein